MLSELQEIIGGSLQIEALSAQSVLLTMLTALVCGALIYMVYRFFYRGVVYSDNFGALIVLISVITAFIIITIGANLVLSLGMVGALSIVRFRAAVKDPLDVGFLFWAVAAGLTAGARLYLVALIATAFIALVYVGLMYLKRGKRLFLLILRYPPDFDGGATELVGKLRYKLKNKTFAANAVELTVEVQVKSNDTSFLSDFTNNPSIESAVLVEYTGDYN
ncbi:DUF4956 domain-containing protein [Clostridia bacterium]|nr:DUF4956 domain-containing protein [Clostridia bacterium]